MFRKSTLLAACAALVLTAAIPPAFASGKHESRDKESVDRSDRHDDKGGDRNHDKHDGRGGDSKDSGHDR
jgi:hypothetical protein